MKRKQEEADAKCKHTPHFTHILASMKIRSKEESSLNLFADQAPDRADGDGGGAVAPLKDTHEDLHHRAILLWEEDHDSAEAAQLGKQALALASKQLGPDHPDTLVPVNNLAVLLMTQSKLDEAEPLHRRALAGRILPPAHEQHSRRHRLSRW